MWCLVLRARNFITDRSDRGLYIIIKMSIEFFSYVFVLVEIFTECEKKIVDSIFLEIFVSVICGIPESQV